MQEQKKRQSLVTPPATKGPTFKGLEGAPQTDHTLLDIDLALGKTPEVVYNDDQMIVCPVCREESCIYTVRIRGGR